MELCVAEETLKRVRKLLFFKTNDLLGQFLSKDSIISKKKKVPIHSNMVLIVVVAFYFTLKNPTSSVVYTGFQLTI